MPRVLCPTLLSVLTVFRSAFTWPSFQSFVALISGWVLSLRGHCTTAVVVAAGAVTVKHVSCFHRFFSQARWSPEQLYEILLKLVVATFCPHGQILLVVDDSLCRHKGKHISGSGWHYDAALSNYWFKHLSRGHVWVVFSICITWPGSRRQMALPVSARLYRTEKTCEKEGYVFQKKPALCAAVLQQLAAVLPDRQFHVVADNAYTNKAVLRSLPSNMQYTGRSKLKVSLFAPPVPHRGRGRPAKKGRRLAGPRTLAADPDGWQRLTVCLHDKSVVLKVKDVVGLWYEVLPMRPVRMVVVRGYPGSDNDAVICTTDLQQSLVHVLETFASRWTIETMFRDVKQRMGFDEPQNRTAQAVHRTAPMALISHSLTVIWYRLHVKLETPDLLPSYPWWHKTDPTFQDMQAELRRASWNCSIIAGLGLSQEQLEKLAPLLIAASYAS